jgi:predicted dehydrogenase/threonine dehydrogenase-like Zn-dependent dehydrogenase
MKQIIQDLKSGETILEKVPVPEVRRGCVLIKTHRSLVSLGTERMLVEFGKANFLDKARQQPEKVKQVLNKVKTDGLKPTLEAVFRKLGEPLPLGYCNAGEIISVGEGVTEFKIGDRVVSNGHHAEVVCIPKNLVAKMPENVSYEEASFTVIGAIGLQGIRLINPTFGETIVVVGLGLIGLIAAQLLAANGCEVIGFDFDDKKVDLAKSWGIKAFNAANNDPVSIVQELTNQTGADGVIITASTKSNDVISQAAKMSRKRGRIVLVGVIGLDIQRSDFYEKELSFQVSCSYGPGRYDDGYEQKGNDYPIGFVRWTEKRNFEAILNALSKQKLQVQSLITEVVAFEDYLQIYGDMKNSRSIASILKYNGQVDTSATKVAIHPKQYQGQKGIIGIIGAGNFTSAMIVPTLAKLKSNIKYIASSKGLSGTTLAKKYKIAYSTTNYQDILKDDEVDTVFITTRHNAHAQQVLESLKANKHVFVEKPLALTSQELDAIETLYRTSDKILMVGFNRRFSPFIKKAKELIGSSNAPINVIATMNAGTIPAEHWTQDMTVGGGRIIGEACHYIDLITYLTGSSIMAVCMSALGANPMDNTDNAIITLKYENGSQAVINYFANGSKAYSKERVEIHAQEKTLVMDNFRSLEGFGYKNFSSMSKSQDKGHEMQFETFMNAIKNGGRELISFADLVNTTRASFAAIESLKTGQWVKI